MADLRPTLLLTRVGMIQWLRSGAYGGVVAAGAVLVIAAVLLNELSGSQTYRLLSDVGLFFVTIISSVLATAYCVLSFGREVESREIQTLLARPVSRDAVLLSKAAVGVILVALTNVSLGAFLGTLSWLLGAETAWRSIPAAAFGAFEGATMVCVLFALASGSKTVFSAIIGALFFMVARIGGPSADLQGSTSAWVRFLPRFDRFDLSEWARGGPLPDDLLQRSVYGVLLIATFTAVALLRFRRRDLF